MEGGIFGEGMGTLNLTPRIKRMIRRRQQVVHSYVLREHIVIRDVGLNSDLTWITAGNLRRANTG
jgi:hypothetical protein